MKTKKILFFDVETNGFIGSSVLSFSAILVRFGFEDDGEPYYRILEKYDRYYYPIEAYNEEAIKINGLDEETITERRGDSKYSKYFKTDDNIIKILEQADAYVAHNIKFDRSFMPIEIDEESQFCTMLSNVDVCKIPSLNAYSDYKWPKLMECVEYYEIPYDENKLHNSLYDIELTLEVFLEMLNNDETYDFTYKFLYRGTKFDKEEDI